MELVIFYSGVIAGVFFTVVLVASRDPEGHDVCCAKPVRDEDCQGR